MNKALAKGLFVIIGAGIELLAERIINRRKAKGRSDGLFRGHSDGPADDLAVQPSGSLRPTHSLRGVTRLGERWRSIF